ncbi:MAG: nodulation protein NfeD [Dehalococcoidia bacterium]|nr:MAG: nodulation protein NfeD [Dehalococcoidia bacterium]
MLRLVRWLVLLFLLAILPSVVGAQTANSTIDVLHAEGTINPVLADYIERGINQSEEDNAILCIIQLDTPGGLLDSTEEIVVSIMNADIPIVVYVSPKGAWAASAGVFITLSGHIAAMTPGTTIGAAHPVTIGDEQISEDELEKITNFSAKWMQTIAEARGRNAEEAQLAVTESKSFTDMEALDVNLIDIRAETLENLISQIDGWQLTMPNGNIITLDTHSTEVRHIKMNAVEGFLFAITDPNIAYILLSLAILGITVEIFNPGLIFPGVAGAISGMLAFYALGMMPVNYAGILLMVLAFGLFIAEAFTPTFGLLTAGGITSLVMGSLILFKGGSLFQVNIWLIILIAVIFAAFLAFVINRIVTAHKRQATTGREELLGKTAVVRSPLEPEGKVLYEGEIWTAVLDQGRAELKEEVIIKKFDGLKLYVTKKDKGDN